MRAHHFNGGIIMSEYLLKIKESASNIVDKHQKN